MSTSPSTPPQGLRAGLKPLVMPIYLPSFVYAAGASILVPVQVLLALHLGFSASGVAMMATLIGAFAIACSVASGYLVGWLGETRAVVLVTAIGVLGLCVSCGTAMAHTPGARWVLLGALVMFDLVDAVWSLARQGMVADLAPAHLRGRAMNLYGACQRLGRMVGPFAAAGVLALADAAVALPVCGAFVAIATALLVQGSRSREPRPSDAAPAPDQVHIPGAPSRRRGLMAMAIGVVVLSALRTAKETLIPLWSSQGVHLAPAHVALVVGLASAMELVLFWPAGLALDRLGRMPVVVTALALMGLGLALMPLHTQPSWLVGAALLVGLGDGAGAGIVKTLGVDLAPTEGRSQFLGWWQGVASAGSFAAPAITSVLVVVASLSTAVTTLGMAGVAGAAWMAWWTPRVLPRRQDTGVGARQ